MDNQFRRKLAAFLAAVMFTTSVPVPVIAEDSADTTPAAAVETIPESAAETTMVLPTEPVTEPVTEPAAKPEEQPAETPKEPLMKSVGKFAASSGITLEMVSEEAFACALVDFRVSAPGADTYTLDWYDAERNLYDSSENDLTDGVGTFQSWVDEPCTEIIVASAEIDGVVYTDELTVVYASRGKTPGIPQINCEDMPVANRAYKVSWTAVEGADMYYLCWIRPDGQYGYDYVEGTSYTIPANLIYMEGEYCLQVAAVKSGYELGDKAEKKFSVTETFTDSRISITSSAHQITIGDSVKISVSAPGAEAIRLYNVNTGNDWWFEEKTGTQHEWVYYLADDRSFYAEALYDGVWTNSGRITVTVLSNGKLEDPKVTVPSKVRAGEEVTVTWEPVENVEEYSVDLYRGKNGNLGEYVGNIYHGAETSAVIDYVLEPGSYSLDIYAYADGYKSGQTGAVFTVTGELAAPPALTLDAESCVPGSKITYTITAEGAETIRLRYYGTTDNGYNSEDIYEFAADGMTTVYEKNFYTAGNFNAVCSAKINGVWSAWSEPVSFEVHYLGKLESPVLTMKDSYLAGEEIAVAWSSVENTEGYSIVLWDSDDNHIDGWWTESEETTIVLDAILGAGNYEVSVEAHADGWESPGVTKHAFTVTGTLKEGPSFTVKEYANLGMRSCDVFMEGATRFRMLKNDTQIREYEAEDGKLSIGLGLYETMTLRFSAYVNGLWTAYGPAQELKAAEQPALAHTYPILPETVRAGENIEVTWNPVEHAQQYRVFVSRETGDNHAVQVWSDYLDAATEGCRTVIPAGELKQGRHYISVTPSASGYVSPPMRSMLMEVGAPLPGNEYDYYLNGSKEVYLYEYLGYPVPEELVIPDTFGGGTVTDISGGCLKNDGTLKKVTIPASVTYIAENAFEGSVDLTICGYSGTEAEEYAIVNGYAFEALDGGETGIAASWAEPVLINTEMTFTVAAPGATEVIMYEGGYKEYYATVLLTQGGAEVKWTPEETGRHVVRFEAKIGDERITTKNYVLNVTNQGQMPKVRNLKASASSVEPGTAVTITWDAPENVTAPTYGVNVAEPGDSVDDISYWYDVTPGAHSYTFRDSWFVEEGIYTLAVCVKAEPGYEASVTTCTVEVKSTKTWDFIPSSGELTAYHGTEKEIVIPAKIDGKTVRSLGDSLFADSNITSVVIPEGVQYISNYAFENCKSLTSVSLPSTLKYIYMRAFGGCSALKQIQLPEGLYYLGSYVFSGCRALTSVVIPSGITELAGGMFYQCAALSQVTLPDGLASIASDAFAYCDSLRTITIPQSVNTIDKHAFRNNNDLTIRGYSGSAAETFAEEQGYTFVALDMIQTGDISFTLERDTLYQHAAVKVTVTAPEAEKLRMHLDGAITEHNIYNGKATISGFPSGLGEHTVSVSQCVDGNWLAPCEPVTITVVELKEVVIEPIASVPAGTPVTVRWKPVEGAEEYSLYLYLNNAGIASYYNIVSLDQDGFVYQELTAENLVHKGVYKVQVDARAEDGGYSQSTRNFEVTEAVEFFYEVNADGTATLTGYTGSLQEIAVPAALDGHAVVKIAQHAFLNSHAVSVELPASVEVVEQQAFFGCETLETVKIMGGQATIQQFAFEDCTKLANLYLGKGIFLEDRALDKCRTDTVVHGYSGGRVEELAESTCQFSSLGELAEGPAVTAENIWQNEQLNYSVSYENAQRLYIQEIYPDGSVESYLSGRSPMEAVADRYAFDEITEDCEVQIKASALVNGEWTSYGQKTVTVSALGVLTAPVFDVIGSLERHLDHVIKWYPVENAQRYRVTISNSPYGNAYEQIVETSQITLNAGDLPEGNYTIQVTAMAEGCIDATGSAEFDVISLKLEQPVVTVAPRVARHLGTRITWTSVPVAENYTVVVSTEGANGPFTVYRNIALEQTELLLTPEQLKTGDYTVSVTANALYCTSSDPASAEFEVYEEPLDAPEVTAPETVVGGVPFDITWKSVKDAERYHLEIMDETDSRIYNVSVESRNLSHTVTLDRYRPEQTLTLRVIASADFRVNGVTEAAMDYLPLYSYEVVDGDAVITGYNGPDTVLQIPGWINGYKVIAIGDNAFEDNSSITAVHLDYTVEIIGDRSFKNCTALQRITGPGVREIGEEAFYNCTSLTHISLGEYQSGVTVKPNAFYNTPISDPDRETIVDGLLNIIITDPSEVKDHSNSMFVETVAYREGITEIPARTHYNNILLRKVALPKSLKTIGSEAFAECSVLRGVWLYDGVEEIAEDAFSNSDNLCLYIRTSDMERVSYVEQYAMDHNIPYVKSYINPMISVIYPEGTYGIAERDFFRNEFLQHVYLPESLQFIQSKAFAQCENLLGVYLYDGITSIADDAFDGSDNVRFIIYVTDPETVSYVEQYAKDHGILYTKLLKDEPASDSIQLGEDTGPITVKIDTPIQITVIDIPADADHLNVYLDGETIYSVALDQAVSVGFSYTFRQFGQHLLTAEAFRDGEVIKISAEKPVIVTGIRLAADKESAWTCETVNFTVEAYPAAGALHFYAEEMQFGIVSLEETVGTFAYAFTQAGDRQITVRSDSGLVSETLTLPILCIGQLDQPVLEAEELQYAGDGLVCSWDTTEHTDGYVLYVRNANGQDILQRKIADDGSERMSCTISAEELGGEGTYQLYLMNYGYKYDQNESETIAVELTADKTPRFTMDKQSVETGEPVRFTFWAMDATSVELWADGVAIETVPLTNGQGSLSRAFTQSGDRKMQIRALQDGNWTELSEVQILKVTSKGALAAVQVTAEPVQMLGNSIKASWTAAANADGYTIYFRNAAHETIYKLDTRDYAVSVPADLVQQTGSYYFMVIAYGKGYDQSEGSANVTVTDRLPGPVIVTPAENQICTNTSVKLTWQAVSGAENYVVSLARKTDRVDADGQPVYEKVWAAPNETVNVGTDRSYDLTDLVYGGEYRVAVGAACTLENGTQCIGWTERLFSVQLPVLSVTLTADTLIPHEGGRLTLTAVANHPMTQAVLTDETGAAVETVSSVSEVVNDTRVFTFVITEAEQGQKTYTVTVSGTDALEAGKSVSASLNVQWIDPDAAAIERVALVQDSVVVDKLVVFTITANSNTTGIEVYRQGVDADSGEEEPVAALKPISSENGKNLFYYITKFEEVGEVTLRFVPSNADQEKGTAVTKTVVVLLEEPLPAPRITNLEPDAAVSNWGYTVKWDPVKLDQDKPFGGYSVTVYRVGSDGHWEAIPEHYNIFVGTACSYDIPGMDAGRYRIEVYTVPAGMDVPLLNVSGCSFVEFRMVEPAVNIETPEMNATVLVGSPIPVNGTVAGGITKVRVQLVTNEKPIPVKDADGNAVEYLVADVTDGKFSVVLTPVNDLTPSWGDATNHAVEVYGFLDGYPTEIEKKAASDWRMLNVDGAEIKTIQSNKVSPNNWVFVGENVHIEVTASKLVEKINLLKANADMGLTIHKDEETSKSENYFWADFKATGEGLHKIQAVSIGVNAEPKTVNVYVVKPTVDTPKYCPGGQTVDVWLIPDETYKVLGKVTSADTLVQKGTCGEYILIEVNGSYRGFVHQSKLGRQYRIISPAHGQPINLEEIDELIVQWEKFPGAVSYKVKITIDYGQGSPVCIEETVQAADGTKLVYPVEELIDKDMRSMFSEAGSLTVGIEAYG